MPTLRDYDDIERDLQGLSLAVPQELQAAADRDRVAGINQGVTDVVRTAGLGLARGFDTVGNAVSQGLDAITPSQDTLYRIFAGLEAAGAAGQGRTPLYLQQQQMQQQMQLRRDALAQQLQQQEESQRQHDLQLFEKAMSGPRAPQMMQALAQNPGYSMSKQAGQFARVMKEADYGALQAYIEFIPEEIQQKFMAGQLSDQEMSAWVDEARTAAKENAKQSAKATIVQRALNKAPEQRSPYETQLVEEHQTALDLKKADIDLKKAQAAKAQREADEGKLDKSNLNRVALAETGMNFEALPPGGPQQKAVIKKYAELYPEGRVGVQMATPAPVKERTNIINRKEFLRSGALVQPPAGATEGQIRGGDYVEITDKQKDAWGEIVNSGTTLDSLFSMVEPLITAKTPAQAAKQYAALSLGAVSKRNPAAATYLADSEAFSSRMARVFGSEVGVLTQGDVDRWKRALPTFGDTVDVAKTKKKVFMDIYKQSRAMAIKKIAGEDTTKDYQALQQTLKRAETISPPSIDEDFDTLMGTK